MKIRCRLAHFSLCFFFASVLLLPQVSRAEIKALNELINLHFHDFANPTSSVGDFSFGIPISVPQGQGGFSPSLGLSYNSEAGPGLAGHGWSMSLSCIERRGPVKEVHSVKPGTAQGDFVTQVERYYGRGVPTFDDAQDTFYFGGQRLVNCADLNPARSDCPVGTETEKNFRTESGGSNLFVYDADSKTWVVKSLSGSGMIFEDWVGVDTNKRGRWCVSKIVNHAKLENANLDFSDGGISVDFHYLNDHLENRGDRNFYPDYISWGGPENFRVDFVYKGKNRTIRSASNGFVSRMTKTIDFVDVKRGPYKIRRYKLTHDTNRRPRRLELLTSVAVCPRGNAGCDSSSPTYQFDYGKVQQPRDFSVSTNSAFDSSDVAGYNMAVNQAIGGSSRMIDLNCDGRADLVKHMRKTHRVEPESTVTEVLLNNGRNGWQESPTGDSGIALYQASEYENAIQSAGIPGFILNHYEHDEERGADDFWDTDASFTDMGVRSGDFNGDGCVDFIQLTKDSNTTSLKHRIWIQGRDNASRPVFKEMTSYFDLDDAASVLRTNNVAFTYYEWRRHLPSGARLMDLNGDGLTDIVMSVANLTNVASHFKAPANMSKAFINTGSGFEERNEFAPPQPISIAKPHSRECSFKPTDQLPDSCLLSNNAPMFSFDERHNPVWFMNIAGIKIVDLNSDGLPDLLQAGKHDGSVSTGRVYRSWINQGAAVNGSVWVQESEYNQRYGDNVSYGADLAELMPAYTYRDAWYTQHGFVEAPRDDVTSASEPGYTPWEHLGDRGYRLGDFDGDGNIDLMFSSSMKGRYFFKGTANGGFETIPNTVYGRPYQPPLDFNAVRSSCEWWPQAAKEHCATGLKQNADVMDINGDGWLDLVPNEGRAVLNRTAMREVTEGDTTTYGFNADIGRLTSITTPLGASQAIKYRRIEIEEMIDGDVVAIVPRRKIVVSEVKTHDGRVSSNDRSTFFEYYGGKFDANRRSFLGFAYVKAFSPFQQDQFSEGGANEPTPKVQVTESFFHTSQCMAGKPKAVLTSVNAGQSDFSSQRACEHHNESFEFAYNPATLGTVSTSACAQENLVSAVMTHHHTTVTQSCDNFYAGSGEALKINPPRIVVTADFKDGRINQEDTTVQSMISTKLTCNTTDCLANVAPENIGVINEPVFEYSIMGPPGEVLLDNSQPSDFSYVAQKKVSFVDVPIDRWVSRQCQVETWGKGASTQFPTKKIYYTDTASDPCTAGLPSEGSSESFAKHLLPTRQVVVNQEGSGSGVGNFGPELRFTKAGDKLCTAYEYDKFGNPEKVHRGGAFNGEANCTRQSTTHKRYKNGLYVDREWSEGFDGTIAYKMGRNQTDSAVLLDSFGNVKEVRHPTGSKTIVAYDRYNRILDEKTVVSGDTMLGQVLYAYSGLGNPSNQYVEIKQLFNNTDDPKAGPKYLKTRRFFDGLGREYHTVQSDTMLAELDLDPHLRDLSEEEPIHAFKEYNQRGMVQKASLPIYGFRTYGLDPVWSYTNYDIFGRVEKVFAPGSQDADQIYRFADVDISSDTEVGGYLGAYHEVSIYEGSTTKKRMRTYVDQLGQTRLVAECKETGCGSDVDTTKWKRLHHFYDDRGNMIQTTLPKVTVEGDPVWAKSQIAYDGFGRKQWMKDYDMSACHDPTIDTSNAGLVTGQDFSSGCPWGYEYDRFGNLVRQKDAEGQTVNSQFDGLGREIFRWTCTADQKLEAVSFFDYEDNTGHLHLEGHIFDLPTSGNFAGHPIHKAGSACPDPDVGWATDFENRSLSLVNLWRDMQYTPLSQVQRKVTRTIIPSAGINQKVIENFKYGAGGQVTSVGIEPFAGILLTGDGGGGKLKPTIDSEGGAQ